MSTTPTALTPITAAPQPIRLSGRVLTLARVVWCVFAIYPVVLFVLGITPALNALQTTCDPSTCIPLHWGTLSPEQASVLEAGGISLEAYAFYFTALEAFQAVVFAGCGCLIFLRRSDEGIALLASLAVLALGVYLIPNTAAQAGFAFPALSPLLRFTFVWGNWLFPALLFLLPDGRLVPRWGLWFFLLWGGYATYAILTHDPATSTADDPISRLGSYILLLCTTVGVYGQIYRYVRVAPQPQRQQIKWLGLGLLGIVFSMVLGASVPNLPMNIGDTPVGVRLLAYTLIVLGFSFFPIALTFAILRHRLWDIDLVLNRTLVYGGLTAAIVAFYAFIVGGLGALFHAQGNAMIAYLGVSVIALLFQPLRQRLQRAVNRLMFGQRDEPYAVLAQFGRQLETTPALDTLLPTIVHTIKETLKLPVVEIEVNGELSSISPITNNPLLFTFPLLYQAEPIGRLIVSPREGETALSATDRHLLEDLARQAGVAVHAARATAELQNARERLVMTREEERRRLRRDLHDGLGPTLAALTAQAEAARDLIPTRPEQSITLLEDMVAQAQTATADIRRLVYNLRPPALDDLGLIGAIQCQAQKVNQTNGLTVIVSAGPLPPLPAAVEVAAYRIVQEALANVVRHAQAKHCRVSIATEQENLTLCVEIEDDGRGLPPKAEAGVGLTSMRERADELGGGWSIASNDKGTKVQARLPLPQIAHG